MAVTVNLLHFLIRVLLCLFLYKLSQEDVVGHSV